MQVATYEKEEFRRVEWDEYVATLAVLVNKVRTYVHEQGVAVDAVVPILRASGIAGQVLAYMLRVVPVLPVQYKYLEQDGTVKLVKIQDEALSNVYTPSPVLLIVENSHCFGTTARTAVGDIRARFPDATILYAATYMDYSHQDMPDADVVFYGMFTNETKALARDKARELGIQEGVLLFPWEDVEEEWAAVTGQPFAYNGKPA